MVVTVGLAVGLLTVAELSPADGDQLYVEDASLVSPIPAPEVLDTQVLLNGLPALTVGTDPFTVTVTVAVAVQPLAVVVLVTV